MDSKVEKTAARRKPPNAGKGRKKGVPNKFSGTVKQTVLDTYARLGGVEAMLEWAQGNKGEFYRIYSRLLPRPLEVMGEGGGPLQTEIAIRLVKGDG